MHNGKEKKLVFNINNFSKFKDKIIYIVVDKLPDGLCDTTSILDEDEKGNKIIDNTLLIEHTQRNSILKGLVDADNEDLIIADTSLEKYQKVLLDAGLGKITTEIKIHHEYFLAEEYHQQYLDKNPNGYCGIGGTGYSFPNL